MISRRMAILVIAVAIIAGAAAGIVPSLLEDDQPQVQSERIREIERKLRALPIGRPARPCLKIRSGVIADIEAGLKARGATLRSVGAADDRERVSVYFVSGYVQRRGQKTLGPLATWATTSYLVAGDSYAIDQNALDLSTFSPGAQTKRPITSKEIGYEQSRRCAQQKESKR